MSRFLLLTLVSVLCFAAPAQAQRESDFEYAMENGDFALAEEAVLVEIERVRNNPVPAEDGALQLTLASLRLAQENYAGAIEPAHEAQRLLGDAVPSLALLLARAEFGVRANAATAETLRNRLLASGTDPSLAVHIHHGAIQLATWAMREQRFDEARDAWRMALRTSDASLYGAYYGRGIALIGEASATLYVTPPGADDFAAIQAQYEEGLQLLRRETFGDDNPVEVSREEQAYAEAVAWYRVWRAYAEAHNAPAPSLDDSAYTGFRIEGFNVQRFPICNVAVVANPPPRMPGASDRAGAGAGAGAAMFWIRFTPEGEIVDRRLLTVVGGDQAFRRSVERLAPRWRIDLGEEPGCSYPLTVTFAVVFRFRE